MRTHLPILAAAGVMLAAAGASAQPVQLSAMAQLGKDMFFDRSLSGSGAMSCATCHDPAHHFARPTIRPCRSAAPISASPAFAPRPRSPIAPSRRPSRWAGGGRGERGGRCDADGGGQRGGQRRSGRPIGGCAAGDGQERHGQRRQHGAARRHVLGRAGRYASGSGAGAADVALRDGQSDIATLAEKVRKGYGDRIAQLAGRNVLDDPQALVGEAGFAIAAIRSRTRSSTVQQPYDDYLAGKATLSEQEMRGLKVYEDRNRAIAPTAIRTSRQPTARRRSSPTSSMRRSAHRAIARSRPMPIRSISISASAGRCAMTIMRSRRKIAGSSRRRACAMRRRGVSSSTMVCSTRSKMSCTSMRSAIPTRRASIRRLAMVQFWLTTTCRWSIAEYRCHRSALQPQGGRQAGAQ